MAAQDVTDVKTIRHLLDRFPENEKSVQDLIARDQTFAALCREYRQTEQEIERLRQRYEQIEEELLTRIEGYTPV